MSTITSENLIEVTGVQEGQAVVQIGDKWVIVGGINQTNFITESTSTALKFRPNTVTKHTLAEGDTFTFDTSSLGSNQCATMELWLTMPEAVVSFTISGVTWIEEPSFDAGNILYAVVLRWDGSSVKANIAYTLEVS